MSVDVSTSVREFWGSVLGRILGQSRLNHTRPVSCDPHELIDFGRRIHLLEWLDVLDRGDEDWPPSLRRAAREQRTRTAFRNQRLLSCLDDIEETASGSLPLIVLKGIAFLREHAYPKGVRRLSDLDLLVCRRDLRDWHRLLLDRGFRAYRDLDWILSADASPYISSTRYTRRIDNLTVIVELHWHLVDFPPRRRVGPWNFSMDPFWDRADDHRMDVTDRFVYQCDHAFKHGWRFWKHLLDLYRLRMRRTFDPIQAVRLANRLFMTDPMTMSLDVCERITGVEMALDSDHETLATHRLSESVRARYVHQAEHCQLDDEAYFKACMLMIKGWLKRFQFVWFSLVPPVSELLAEPSRPSLFRAIRLYVARIVGGLTRGAKIWFRI